MKKILLLPILLLMILNSCEEKKSVKKEKELKQKYSIDIENSSVNWTAYKTTDKVAVKGTFKEVNIENIKSESSMVEAINGLVFNIPVTSIYSKDSIRDAKLVKFFFGNMDNSMRLKGELHLDDKEGGSIAFTMNGLTKNLPITYKIDNDIMDINGVMDLNTWEAKAAIAILNEACFELHKGKDGVSKTWEEIGVNAKLKIISNQ